MARTFRFWFHLTLIATLLVLASRAKAGDVTVRGEDGKPWTIRITPRIPAVAVAVDETLAPPAPESTEVSVNPAVSATSAVVTQPEPSDDNFGIRIIPAIPKRASPPSGGSYDSAYREIPYSRSEYLANPSYRHDSAMEMMFGVQRPTTMVRDVPGQVVQQPEWTPYRPYLNAQWDYYQTAPLLRPRYYAPLLPRGFYW